MHRQRCKDTLKHTYFDFGSSSKLGQAGPWRENEAGQKVQQPNGEVEEPEGWCDGEKRRNTQRGRVMGKRDVRGERKRRKFM